MVTLSAPVDALAPPPAARPAVHVRAARTVVRLAVVVVLYVVYALARNENGLASADAGRVARRHADHLVAIERALGLPSEHVVQQMVLDQTWLVRASGAFYGTAHFLATLGVLLLLALRLPDAFDRWAATLAGTTFLSVAAFALFPVAPPRLLPGAEGTVDTLATFGGVWSYDHGVLERISDPYAALPSLHLAWATWCGLVLWQWAATSPWRRGWRVVAVAHPLVTAAVVLVTGNHWYLDAVAGTALLLAVHALLSLALRQAPGRRRRDVATASS